jgi:hypothetical protein
MMFYTPGTYVVWYSTGEIMLYDSWLGWTVHGKSMLSRIVRGGNVVSILQWVGRHGSPVRRTFQKHLRSRVGQQGGGLP